MSDSHVDVLLTGGTVVTVDDVRRVIHDGVVAVVGDRITHVGTSSALGSLTATTRLDCSGALVIPGMIDTHTHLFQAPARGHGDGLPVIEWLSQFMWPYASTLTAQDAVNAASYGAMRAALSGTTTVLDHHYAPTSSEATLGVAGAIEAIGLRGAVARGMLGDLRPDSPMPASLRRYSTSDDIAITRECMEERPPGCRVAVWPGPGSVHACDPGILIAAAELADTHNCRWHTHTSESQRSVHEFLERHGARPITWLERHGLLERSVHAHAIHLDETEIDALSGSAGVAHCPVSNGYLASGIAPVTQLLSRGVTVGLGTDGAAVTGDGIAECGKQMMLLQRLANNDPACVSADDVLRAATRDAADMLGLDCGRLEVGRLADIVVLDLPQSLESSSHTPAVEVFGFPSSFRVRSVIVGGTSIVSNGHCTLIDETDVMRRAEGLGTRAARPQPQDEQPAMKRASPNTGFKETST